jgi:hypothetical protein
MQVIQHQELASSQASITFSSIPQTYTDLVLLVSARNTVANYYSDTVVTLNNQTSSTTKVLYGLSGSSASYTATDGTNLYTPGTTATANTFGNTQIYFPNYTLTGTKSTSFESVTENNSANYIIAIGAGSVTNGTNPINTITISLAGGSFTQYSTATLYGILAGSDGTTVVS